MKVRVRIDNVDYEVEIGDLSTRPVIAKIDGEEFEVWPEETAKPAAPAAPVKASAPAPAAPATAAPAPTAGGGDKVMPAPIPGVIISIAVKAGQTVNDGDELLVLEAMKMKNTIRANRSGTIAEILVATGETVAHGQGLIEYTD